MEHSVTLLLGDWQRQQPKDMLHYGFFTYFYVSPEGTRLYFNGVVTGLIALELF